MSIKKLLVTVCAFLPLLTALQFSAPAHAITINYNNLIDDSVFDNYGTMSVAQIDAFLNSFPSSCISTNNGFTASDPTGYTPTASSIYGKYSYGSPVSAGRVIYDAAVSHKINPQVILATLEKEETLVSGSAGCSSWRYVSAVGYGCTDSGTNTHNYSYPSGGLLTPLYYSNGSPVNSITGSCVNRADIAGFSEQVIHFAWLMSFSRHRAAGQSDWAIVSGSWNHCDDNATCAAALNIPSSWACYSGFMTQGTWARCSNGSATFYDGYATIDSSSVHMDNGSTAALYVHTPHKAGNANFETIFISWFKTVRGTPFMRLGNTPAVYMFGSNNNYYLVSSSAELRTYGYGTAFANIDSVTSSYLSDFTNSGTLPLVAQFEDPTTTYLVDSGSTHRFADSAILAAFGYGSTQPAQLPRWIYDKLPHASDMAAVTKEISSPAIYYVSNGKKSHISNPTAYSTLGSPTYNTQPSVVLSDAFVAGIPIGAPILVANTITRASDTNAYGYWDGTQLQSVSPVVGTSSGIAVDYTTSSAALNQLPISPNPAIGKLAQDSTGKHYIIDTKQKFSVTDSQLTDLGLSGSSFSLADDGYLARFTTLPMTTVLFNSVNGYIYSVQAGKLYHIYSPIDFREAGFNSADVLHANSSTLGLFSNSNMQLFAPGRLLRINKNPQVYFIANNFIKVPIMSHAIFDTFGFLMTNVASVSSTALMGYISGANLAQINKDASGNFWFIDQGYRHSIPSSLLGSTQYNINQSSLNTLPDRTLNALPAGNNLSDVFRIGSQATVYEVVNGQKRPFSSRSAFESSGNSWSDVLSVSALFADSIPTGSPV